MRYLEVAQDLIVRHPCLSAAVLVAILLILLWWAAEKQFAETITRMPGGGE